MIDQRILLVVETGESDRTGLGGNIDEALFSSKIDYHICSPAAVSAALAKFSYSCVILAIEHNRKIDAPGAIALINFVEKGGGLVALTSTRNEQLAPLLGISAFSPIVNNLQTYTLQFVDMFYPGIENLAVECDGRCLKDTPIPNMNSNVRLLAWDNSGTPRAWYRKHGKGNVFCWNTTLITEGHKFQGVLIQSILMCQASAVLPIVNAAVIQIDDFPAGHSVDYLRPVSDLYGLSTTDFYSKMWLPDILALGKEFDIPFTWFTIFTYDLRTSQPFSFLEWECPTVKHDDQEVSYTRDCISRLQGSGELGLHGLNHVPLLEENWVSHEDMRASLRAAMDRWKMEDLGALPRCYVAPMNEIDQMGLSALLDEVPTITTISTIFVGDFEKGQSRMPGFEPWNEDILSLPRLTYGYAMTDELQFAMVSLLARLGMWTHFFHPDDIFDNPENNPEAEYYRNPSVLGWNSGDESKKSETLYGKLYEWIRFTKQKYPWLSFVTTTEATARLKRHINNDVQIRVGGTEASVDATEPVDIQFRVQSRISEDSIHLRGGSLLYTQSSSECTLLFIRMKERRCHIKWKGANLPPEDSEHLAACSTSVAGAQSNLAGKRQICFVVDKRGWAYDGIAKNISHYLRNSWAPVIIYTEDFERLSDLFRALYSEEFRFDVVHFFWRPVLASLFNSAVIGGSIEGMDADSEAYFLRYISTCCNTTSVYDHLFLSDCEESTAQLVAIEKSDGCTVASSKLRNLYSKKIKSSSTLSVIEDGVDLEMFYPEQKELDYGRTQKVVVGWAGNSVWGEEGKDHKGLNSIIKPAIEQLRRENLAVKGDYCDRAERWRPKETMPAYYHSLDIYVCASLDEGTPNPVLEAMASGLPVLSTDVGIVRDAFGPLQQSYIVSDRNSLEFIEKLRQLVTNPDLRSKLAQENLLSIQAWSWKYKAELWHDFFEASLAEKSSI